MKKIRCAVIGVGYLGRFHAQKFKMLGQAELVGVCDVSATVCDSVSKELNVSPYYDYRALFGHVDAVSIAATTKEHYEIAKACLENGIHVLIEKPMTETVAQAKTLIELANANQLKLQIGHLERFNAARLGLNQYIERPLFIEAQRLAPFNPRGTDVNVVLDLMIHDIDIIQDLVRSPIEKIEAYGTSVLSPLIDIANARIVFKNQCVANISASRVSFKTTRKTRIYQPDNYISIDFQEKQFAIFKKGSGELFPGIPNIIPEQFVFEKSDALLEEIKAFLHCIQNDTPPVVTGEDGCSALQTAETITALIDAHLEAQHALA